VDGVVNMKKSERYKQCYLFKREVTVRSTVSSWTTRWIPVKYAKVNDKIEIRESESDEWVMWTVVEVYKKPTVSKEYLGILAGQERNTRKVSDV